MSRLIRRSLVVAALALAFLPGRADASLTTFATFTGNVAYSSDGFGSSSNSGTISALVPAGSTVLAAYLWTATNNNPTHAGLSATLNGNLVTFGAPVENVPACCGLASARADVTALVQAAVGGGGAVPFDFTIVEAAGATQDGEALVVVYSNPLLPVATVGILDGFASVTGDSTSINFADPLNPLAPGFFAEMIIGDAFSCGPPNCSDQRSTIRVNGTLITENAGNFDDGELANGALITVGGFDDPLSAALPTYAADREKYNLVPYVMAGDTSINVLTSNASQDDNIFMATFYVSGIAGVNEPPPPPRGVPDQPETLLLLGLGLAAIWAVNYRRA